MKKVLALALSLALIATMAISTTVAYLTSEDSDVNVMTLGNVEIEQHEKERVDMTHQDQQTPAELKDWEVSALFPAVNTKEGGEANDPAVWQPGVDADEAYVNYGDFVNADITGPHWTGVWDSSLKNVKDKMVFVENTGKSDLYYRTIILYEYDETETVNSYGQGMIHFNINKNTRFDWAGNVEGDTDANVPDTVDVNGKKYGVMVATYNIPLKPDTVSRPSLLQVGLDGDATNEVVEQFGDTYDVLVLSQAVQTAGFDSAAEALKAGFGVVNEENLQKWFGDMAVISASDSEELKDAIESNTDATIVLGSGEYTSNFKVGGGKNITIIGSGNTVLKGQIATTASNAGTLTLKNVTVKVDNSIVDSTGISQTGKSAIAIWGDQTVICENVTFDMSLADSTAITSWWDTGVGTSIIVKNCTFNCNGQRPIRATGNVTVENCTFNDPYRYAVQLTAKTSTATELDKAIVNFKNNTIVNGEKGKAFVYGIQLEGADYGCHDLVINGAGNTIQNGGESSTMYYCECGKVDHDTVTFNTEVAAVHES